jgi:uncharacterized protein (DUF58 family)
VGEHLDRARPYLGRDATGLLEGGRYALVHSRSLEFDDLRPYVRGDDVRDIDWKASARSGDVLIKRFVSEKHHKILLVVDAGRNSAALTPSGEVKRDVAAHVIGVVGLVAIRRSDEVGMVFGDARGCVDVRLRRGETHVEYLLHRFHDHATTQPGRSDVVGQLDWVARHHRRRLLVLVVSDEPEVSDGLRDVLGRLTGMHDVMWAMLSDLPAVGSANDHVDGYDVGSGGFVLNGAALGTRVVAAYQRAEAARREQLSELLTSNGVPHATIEGSTDIRTAIAEMTGVIARAR